MVPDPVQEVVSNITKGEEYMSADTDAKLKALEKALEEMQGAIRRIFQENNTAVAMIAKISDDVNTLKGDVANIKKDLTERAKRELAMGRTNY